jgi:putative FmdB family regulatory protein
MPLYEYECEACAGRFEVIQKFSDPHVDTCKRCGKGPVRRLFSSPAIQFKGTGWYITDYAQKGRPAADGGDKSGTDTKETKETKDSKDTKDTGASTAPASTDSGSTKTDSKASAATPS